MSNKYIKRCSKSLVIREMQTKTTMRCHCISTRTADIKRLTISNVGEDLEQLELSHMAGGV